MTKETSTKALVVTVIIGGLCVTFCNETIILLVYMMAMLLYGLHLLWKHMILHKQSYLFSITILLLVIFDANDRKIFNFKNLLKLITTASTTFNNIIGTNKNMNNEIISVVLFPNAKQFMLEQQKASDSFYHLKSNCFSQNRMQNCSISFVY